MFGRAIRIISFTVLKVFINKIDIYDKMKSETRKKVKELVKGVILSKIDNYSAETEYKPFFQAIFTKEQILTHTIVHLFLKKIFHNY